jgi:Phage integrase, N-terminal SAM-like domain
VSGIAIFVILFWIWLFLKQKEQAMNKKIARAELRLDYETYLRRQRGLSERTIFHSWRIVDRFLEFRFGKENGELSRITTTDIVRFLQHLTTRTPPLRDKTLSSHLRNFFRYLFKAGKTATNLALAIPSVAQRYGTRLPRHLTTEQVDMLVRAVRTDSAGGRRNCRRDTCARLKLRASSASQAAPWRSTGPTVPVPLTETRRTRCLRSGRSEGVGRPRFQDLNLGSWRRHRVAGQAACCRSAPV